MSSKPDGALAPPVASAPASTLVDSDADNDSGTAAIGLGGTVELDENNKPHFKPTRAFFLAMSGLMVLTLMIAIDATSLSVAIPIISSELTGTALEAFWSGTSFLLASTVLQPTFASLSNIFGRKYLIFLTLAFFSAGALIGALAGNFTVILAGRTIQGVGGGGLIALSEIVITDMVPLAFRGQWFSLFSAMWSVGSVTGPLIGAGFAQNVSWRWIFWINLPFAGVGVVLVAIFLRQTKIPGGIPQKLARFDWTGSFLMTASSTAFLFGLTVGGVMWGWGSYQVLLPLLLGLAGMVVFAFYELKVAKEPIIDKRIFLNRDLILAYAMTLVHGAALWSIIYFLVLYYQAVKLYTPVISAVALLPESLTTAPAGMVVGIIATITGHYRFALWVGWALTTMGVGIFLLMGPDTTVAQWVWLNIPAGFGFGMLFPAMGLTIQAASPPHLQGQSAAFYSFLRTFGQTIGLAVSGVIFQNSFRNRLQALPAWAAYADDFARDATIVVEVIHRLEESPQRRELMVAYNEALRMIWIALLAFSAFGLVLSVGVKGYSLNQAHVTEQALIDEANPKEKKAPEP